MSGNEPRGLGLLLDPLERDVAKTGYSALSGLSKRAFVGPSVLHCSVERLEPVLGNHLEQTETAADVP